VQIFRKILIIWVQQIKCKGISGYVSLNNLYLLTFSGFYHISPQWLWVRHILEHKINLISSLGASNESHPYIFISKNSEYSISIIRLYHYVRKGLKIIQKTISYPVSRRNTFGILTSFFSDYGKRFYKCNIEHFCITVNNYQPFHS